MITFEARMCRCGREFEALNFWPEDVTCAHCGKEAYRARIESINAVRPYRVDSIGGACPTQSEGISANGQPFYFRARHGEWTLEVGPAGSPPNFGKWVDAATLIAEGDDPSNGWMDDGEVLAILDAHLPTDASEA